MTYSQTQSYDFWPGHLDTINGTIDSLNVAQYDRLWRVNRSEIDSFIFNYQLGNVTNGSYAIPQVILDWPAHGTGNNSSSLAPFVDVNFDNIYNPYHGDYPKIDGDQELWWIFNDAYKPHTESNGPEFQNQMQFHLFPYEFYMHH